MYTHIATENIKNIQNYKVNTMILASIAQDRFDNLISIVFLTYRHRYYNTILTKQCVDNTIACSPVTGI